MRLLFLLLLIYIPTVSASITINEIMYDPLGSDTSREWIEIYNDNGCENLTGWKFYEDATNHGLTLVNGSSLLCQNQYAIIADDTLSFLQEYPSFNGTLFDSTFSLSNTNETIALKNKSLIVIDNVTYYNFLGGNGNGKTLCKINNIWQECSQTPGKENTFIQNITVYTININEFLPDPYGDDNAPMPDGEWIELYNYGNLALDLTGLILSDDYGHSIIITNTRILNSTIIQPNSYIVIYTNGFFGLLNNDGFERLKLYSQSNIIDGVSYDGSKEGVSWAKVNGIWQQTMPTPNKENIDNKNIWEARLEIENIYLGSDNKSKFGDTLRVKVNIYRGNATKETVYLYAEDNNITISKRDSITLDRKYTNYTFTIPLQIFPNCNENYPNGTYYLILSGLDKIKKQSFKVSGITESLCEEIINPKYVNYEIISIPTEANVNEIITIKLKIINSEYKGITFEIWSYLVDITEDTKENLQTITLPAKSSAEIELKNAIPLIQSGNYDYRIKILKEGRKTPKEVTSTLKVLSTIHLESENIINTTNEIISNIVYSSKNIEAKRYALYFMSVVLILLIIKLLIKK